jgi:hypothetical protein
MRRTARRFARRASKRTPPRIEHDADDEIVTAKLRLAKRISLQLANDEISLVTK